MKLNINKIGIKSGRPKFFIIPIPKILSPIPKTSFRSRSPTQKKIGRPDRDSGGPTRMPTPGEQFVT